MRTALTSTMLPIWIAARAATEVNRSRSATVASEEFGRIVVRVTDTDDGSATEWRGTESEWRAAVAEAATRPAFPPEGWAPGHYEAAWWEEQAVDTDDDALWI